MATKSKKPHTVVSTLKQEYCNPQREIDLSFVIMEEVALEGLDGITHQALFARLGVRPGFHIPIDDSSKAYLWDFAKRLKNITIFLMETERGNLRIEDRRDFLDERGNAYEPVTGADDIYEYHPIDDKPNGIRGSCKEYYSRRPYTSVARLLSYEKIASLYGNRIVLVAPQNIRERTMLSEDIDIDIAELSIIQYCILERVARARYPGEITRGKVSLTTMNLDPKSLFYQRKLLVKKRIILKQSFSMKYGPTRSSASVTILHLPRFYIYYETVLKNGIRRTIKSIMDKPNHQMETANVRAQLGKHIVKSFLSKECSEIFEQVDIPFAQVHPELYANEPLPEKRQIMEVRTIKLLRLRDPRINHINFVKLLPKSSEEKEETEESVTSLFPLRFLTNQTSIMHDFIKNIYEAKAKGTSLGELSESNSVTLLDSRSAVRFLQRHQVVVAVLEDKKKTKMNRYVFYKFKEANQNVQKISQYPVDSKSTVPASQDSVFINLEPEEVDVGGITWSIPHLVPLVDLEPEKGQPKITATASSVLSSSARGKLKKKRGNSYKFCSENTIPSFLKLSAEAQKLMDEFVSEPDTEVLPQTVDPHELRFNRGEGNDFIPVTEKNRGKCLVYVNSSGWQILVEEANVRPEYGRLPSFATPKNTNRGNFILEMIYRQKVVLGFQQILRKLRLREASESSPDAPRSDVDRRTVYRILGQFQQHDMIHILKVCIHKEGTERVCAIFTPFAVQIESRLIMSAIEVIVRSALGKTKLTPQEKRAQGNRDRLITRTKLKRNRRGAKMGKLDRTTLPAKPGTRPGSKTFRIKKVYKGSKPMRKTSVRTIPAEIGTRYYDAVDRQALAMMRRARVDWSSTEDRYILCLFLASVLFIPRYNHQKIFMFNSHQIRDVLHSKLQEARSKTALAIRRRIHFLMKKNTFYNHYRYYLTEALSDNILKKKYLAKYHKRTMEGEKIFYRIPTKSLLRVFDYLHVKFHKLSTMDPSAQERDPLSFDRFGISQIESNQDEDCFVETTEDNWKLGGPSPICFTLEHNPDCLMVDAVHTPFDVISVQVWTARTAILSHILSGEDVGNAHRFLSCINNDILDYSINALRIIGLTSWQKPNNRFGPSVMLKRKLHSHLGPDKYHEISILLEELNEYFIKTFRSNDHETIGCFVVLSELHSRDLLKFSIRLPDPVVTVNPQWEEMFQSLVDVMEDKITENGTDSDGLIDFDDEDNDSSFLIGKKRRIKSEKGTFVSTKKLRTPKKILGIPLHENKEESSISGTAVTTDILGLQDVVSCQNDLQEALRTGKSTASSSKALRMSNNSIRVIRSQMNSREPGTLVQRDFFNVNLPDITILADKEGFDSLVTSGTTPKLELQGIKQHLIKVVTCSRLSFSSFEQTPVIRRPKDLGKWTILYNYIAATKDIGISVRFLLTKFTRETLSEGLRFLIVKNAIFLVGVTYRKFVAAEYVQKWTMPVPDPQNVLRVQRVVFRPWITSTGTVNWALIDQTLTAILGYINLHPDISVDDLCEHFVPAVSPVETMILIDALVGLEFFNLYELENKVDVDAFSSPSLVSKNYVVDTFLDMETLYVELHSMTASKYSKLQELINSDDQMDQKDATYNKCLELVV